jgi:hypothetical protein
MRGPPEILLSWANAGRQSRSPRNQSNTTTPILCEWDSSIARPRVRAQIVFHSQAVEL